MKDIGRWLWRKIFYRGRRREVAEALREINRLHATAEKDDPYYQLACEATYCALDDTISYLAALLEGWPRDWC